MDQCDEITVGERELNCFISSVRMAGRIAWTVKGFSSSVVLSRGGYVCDARSIYEAMLLDGAAKALDCPSWSPLPEWREMYPKEGPRERLLTISACGPDAAGAVAALLALFPADGGPARCPFPGCGKAAFLVGPDGNGGFEYRCAHTQAPHSWQVPAGAAPRS